MLIWNLPCSVLDSKRLQGEHRELHIMLAIHKDANSTSGWRHHPETKRWKGHLQRMVRRHSEQVQEGCERTDKRVVDHQSWSTLESDKDEWPPFIYPDGWRGDICHLLEKWIKEDFKYGVGRLSFDEAWRSPEFKAMGLHLDPRFKCTSGSYSTEDMPSLDRPLAVLLQKRGLTKVFGFVNSLEGPLAKRSLQARDWIKAQKVTNASV